MTGLPFVRQCLLVSHGLGKHDSIACPDRLAWTRCDPQPPEAGVATHGVSVAEEDKRQAEAKGLPLPKNDEAVVLISHIHITA